MSATSKSEIPALLADASQVDLNSAWSIPHELQVENLRRRGIDILKISWSARPRRKGWLALLGLRSRSLSADAPSRVTIADQKIRIDVATDRQETRKTQSVAYAEVKSIAVLLKPDAARSHIRIEAQKGNLDLAHGLSEDALNWLRDRLLLETAGLAWRPIHNVGKRTTRLTTNPDEQIYRHWRAGPNKLIELFLEHAPEQIDGLERAVMRGDLMAARHNAHWLKSSAAAVGASYLSELIQRLEIDIDIKRGSEVEGLVDHILKEFGIVTDALRRLNSGAALDDASAALVTGEAGEQEMAGLLDGVRVLLVEDSLVNQEVARDCLETAGCTVVAASDGREAISVFSVQGFDVVLMDCQMSGVDGFHATRSIRQFEARTGRFRTPIVALTAHALMGDRDLCIAAGMDDYLSKPFKGQDLVAAVSKWTGRSVSEAEPDEASVPAAAEAEATAPADTFGEDVPHDDEGRAAYCDLETLDGPRSADARTDGGAAPGSAGAQPDEAA